jgi:GNAT superfamily N-acetyltransferase
MADPYILWLLRSSRRPDGVRILMEYVVDETLARGEVWLTDGDEAAALWHSDRAELFSIRFLARNLRIWIRLGTRSVVRMLRSERAIHNLFPSDRPFFHLYLIGVGSEHRGKGLASELMDPILRRKRKEGVPVVLETANPANVEIYRHKAFETIGTLERDGMTVTVMRR